MKKLLFVLAFAFIGQQAFSQMYLVMIHYSDPNSHPSTCPTGTYDRVMTTIDPQGSVSYTCLEYGPGNISLGGGIQVIINQEFNSIINQGYKLVAKDENSNINTYDLVGTWYFAVP